MPRLDTKNGSVYLMTAKGASEYWNKSHRHQQTETANMATESRRTIRPSYAFVRKKKKFVSKRHEMANKGNCLRSPFAYVASVVATSSGDIDTPARIGNCIVTAKASILA